MFDEQYMEQKINVKKFVDYLVWSRLKEISLKDLFENWEEIIQVSNDFD